MDACTCMAAAVYGSDCLKAAGNLVDEKSSVPCRMTNLLLSLSPQALLCLSLVPVADIRGARKANPRRRACRAEMPGQGHMKVEGGPLGTANWHVCRNHGLFDDIMACQGFPLASRHTALRSHEAFPKLLGNLRRGKSDAWNVEESLPPWDSAPAQAHQKIVVLPENWDGFNARRICRKATTKRSKQAYCVESPLRLQVAPCLQPPYN